MCDILFCTKYIVRRAGMRASSSGTARKRLNERSSVLESGRGKLVIDFNRAVNSPELCLACEGIA